MRGGRTTTKRARALRRQPTDAELRLWYLLRRNRLGLRFRRQFPIPPYFADFAAIDARLIIEADGGQHAVAGEHARRDACLTAKGWHILRFWNHDILKNSEGVLRTIVETVEGGTGPRFPNAASETRRPPPPQPSPVATGEGEPRRGWEGAGSGASIFQPEGRLPEERA